jgi:hypothetical protein
MTQSLCFQHTNKLHQYTSHSTLQLTSITFQSHKCSTPLICGGILVLFVLMCLVRKLLNQEHLKSVSLYTPFSRCSIHNNRYVIKINQMSLQLISTFNGHTNFHFTGHGTQILWWSQSSHTNPLHMSLLQSDRRITAAQLLLYYDHMVQVEHNRTIQQCNICINITQYPL